MGAARGLAVASILLFSVGCIVTRAERIERQEIEEEARQAEAALGAVSTAEALLDVARFRDGRTLGPPLSRLVRHPQSSVRAEVLRALALIGDHDSVGRMEAALSDPSASVRRAAAFSLSQLWSWRVSDLQRSTLDERIDLGLVEALESIADTPGPEFEQARTARALIRALGELDGEAGEELLWDRISDPVLGNASAVALALRRKRAVTRELSADELSRLAAAVGSGRPSWEFGYLLARAGMEDDDGAQQVAEDLIRRGLNTGGSQEGSSLEKVWMVRAVARLETERALPLLRLYLGPNTEQGLRIVAVRGLGGLGEVGLADLRSLLRDADPLLRAEVAAAVGRIGNPEGLLALLDWLPEVSNSTESDAVARLEALAVASEGASDENTRLWALSRRIQSQASVRVRAAGVVLEATVAAPNELVPLAERCGSDVEARIRIACGVALSKRDDAVLEGPFLSWLDGPDVQLGGLAAEALGKRDGAHLTARLIAAYDAHQDVIEWERRQAIATALVDRSDVAPTQLTRMLKDPEPLVRLAVFDGLAMRLGRAEIGEPPQSRPLPEIQDSSFGVGDVTRATLMTSAGTLELTLLPSVAPAAVANFVRLADANFYDGLSFHRVVPDFVVQAGDPDGTGWGGPGWTLRDEFSDLPYVRGTVGMARAGKDTAGSQFFITHSPQPHLEGHYTVFGQVVSGWEVLDALRRGDRIEDVQIHRTSS